MEAQNQNIALCLLTSLLCQASSFTVERNVSHAVGYTILANLVNLFHFTLWDPESVSSSKKDRKTLFAYLPLYVVMGFSYVNAAFWVNKSAVVALGLCLIGIRSSLAVSHAGRPSSLDNNSLEYLVILTGLRLCQEIKLEEAEKAYSAVNGDDLRKESEADDCGKELQGWDVVKNTEFHKG